MKISNLSIPDLRDEDDVLEDDDITFQEAYERLCRHANLFIDSLPLFIRIIKHTVAEDAECMSLYHVYNLIVNNARLLMGSLHLMYDKLYRTLTYDYYDEIKELSQKMEPLFVQFLNLDLHQGEKIKEYIEGIDGHDISLGGDKWFIASERITASLITTKGLIEGVRTHFLMLFFVRAQRSKKCSGLVFRARWKNYQKVVFPLKWERYKKQLFDTRLKYIEPNSSTLNEIRKEWLITINELPLGKCWDEYHLEGDEELAYQLSKLNATEDDMDIFFLTLGKYYAMSKWIEERIEYESKGDDVFRLWVDVYQLKQHLRFWVNGEMKRGKGENEGKTQEYWLVFWCVMNELDMIRKDVRPDEFATKMSEMFPDTEIPCVYESWRKLRNKDNHDKPINRWAANDKFLSFANDLMEKLLSCRKNFSREMIIE